jgi:hypothetical protein
MAVKCRTSIKALFLYLDLRLSVFDIYFTEFGTAFVLCGNRNGEVILQILHVGFDIFALFCEA